MPGEDGFIKVTLVVMSLSHFSQRKTERVLHVALFTELYLFGLFNTDVGIVVTGEFLNPGCDKSWLKSIDTYVNPTRGLLEC